MHKTNGKKKKKKKRAARLPLGFLVNDMKGLQKEWPREDFVFPPVGPHSGPEH